MVGSHILTLGGKCLGLEELACRAAFVLRQSCSKKNMVLFAIPRNEREL